MLCFAEWQSNIDGKLNEPRLGLDEEELGSVEVDMGKVVDLTRKSRPAAKDIMQLLHYLEMKAVGLCVTTFSR